jgi:hypothetical protein
VQAETGLKSICHRARPAQKRPPCRDRILWTVSTAQMRLCPPYESPIANKNGAVAAPFCFSILVSLVAPESAALAF